MATFKINLNTGNRFWTPKGLGAMGMEPSQAIAELVANALDWKRESKDQIHSVIHIYISKDHVEIRDNGVGMNIQELQNAVQVSVSNDSVRPSLRVRKGMFGMGMKVAALSLGWKLLIHTRPLNNTEQENIFFLDTRKLDSDGINNHYRENIVGRSEKKILDGPLGHWESGTSIQISDLTHKNLSAVAIKDSLQEVFSPEINIENAEIIVFDVNNNETLKCEKTSVSIYEDTKIDLDNFDLYIEDDDTKQSYQLRGWLALMKVGASGSGKWGLHLFKHNQIIERFHQLPSRLNGLMPKNPHPKFGRTYGEIHLDMCKPAFHKVGFDYSTDSWKKAAELLAPHLEIIMDASANYRVNNYDKNQKALKRIQSHNNAVKKATSTRTKISENSEIPSGAIPVSDGKWFTIVKPIFEKLGNNELKKPWLFYYRAESKELAIIINSESKLYENLIGNEPNESALQALVLWAISDCVLILLCEEYNYTLQDALPIRDEHILFLNSEKGGKNG